MNVMFWTYGGVSYLFSDFLQLLLVLPDQPLVPRLPIQLPAQRSDLGSAGQRSNDISKSHTVKVCAALQNLVMKDLGTSSVYTSWPCRAVRLLEACSSSPSAFSRSCRRFTSACHSALWLLIMMSICFISSCSSGSQDDRTELRTRGHT